MSEDLRDVPSRADQAVDRAEYIRLLEAEVARYQNALTEAVSNKVHAEAEVARLRDIISPGDAAAYEQGMAVLQAALREWREAESLPDCVACCTLDAALEGK